MEIFQDGELEAEMQKREVKATSLNCWWNIFINSYQEVIHSLCRPPRAKYVIEELGEKQFILHGNTYQRQDFELTNRYQRQVPCSFWYDDTKVKSNRPVPPCIVYLHGLSSSRIEGNYLRDRILSMGFSFFVLDLSGSGMAEGEYVSFGFFEKEDVHAAIDYLYVNRKASKVGLWGHCIGGSAALLALQDSLDYSYKTIQVPRKQALQMKTRVRRRTGEVVIKLAKKLINRGSIASGEHVLIGIDDQMVGFPQKDQVDDLFSTRPTKATKANRNTGSNQMVRLSFKVKKTVPNGHNNFIYAMALDSTFGDGEQVVKDMLDQLGKSASKRNFPIPSLLLSAASKIICNSIKTTANFNLKDVQVIKEVKHFRTPCVFVLSTKIDFIRPEHTEALYQLYASHDKENNRNTEFKSLLRFEGVTHEQNRPDFILDAICQHFQKQNKLLSLNT